MKHIRLHATKMYCKHQFFTNITPHTRKLLERKDIKKISSLCKRSKQSVRHTNKKCSMCKMSFRSVWAYKKHLRKFHRSPHTFGCHICHKGFISSASLERHKEFHQKVELKCSGCNMTFSSRKLFDTHFCEGSGKNLAFQCLFGDLPYSKLDSVPAFSSDKTRFNCRLCSSSRTNKGSFALHRCNKNARSRTNRCLKCSLGFKNSKLLRAHLHGDPTCRTLSITAKKLSKRKQIALKNKAKCVLCKSRFPNLMTLSTHLKKCCKKKPGSKIPPDNLSALNFYASKYSKFASKKDDVRGNETNLSLLTGAITNSISSSSEDEDLIKATVSYLVSEAAQKVEEDIVRDVLQSLVSIVSENAENVNTSIDFVVANILENMICDVESITQEPVTLSATPCPSTEFYGVLSTSKDSNVESKVQCGAGGSLSKTCSLNQMVASISPHDDKVIISGMIHDIVEIVDWRITMLDQASNIMSTKDDSKAVLVVTDFLLSAVSVLSKDDDQSIMNKSGPLICTNSDKDKRRNKRKKLMFKCKLCNLLFPSKLHLLCHIKRHYNSKKSIRCVRCGITAHSTKYLWKCLMSDKKLRKKGYSCFSCTALSKVVVELPLKKLVKHFKLHTSHHTMKRAYPPLCLQSEMGCCLVVCLLNEYSNMFKPGSLVIYFDGYGYYRVILLTESKPHRVFLDKLSVTEMTGGLEKAGNISMYECFCKTRANALSFIASTVHPNIRYKFVKHQVFYQQTDSITTKVINQCALSVPPGKKSAWLKCYVCHEAFQNSTKLISHFSTKHKFRFVQLCTCEHCNTAFRSEELRDSHICSSHEICTFCRESFKGIEELAKHLNDFHRNEIFSCPHCKKPFLKKSLLARHSRMEHREVDVLNVPATAPNFPCKLCHEQVTDVYGHIERHPFLPQMECHICSATFLNQYQLLWHLENAHKIPVSKKDHDFLYLLVYTGLQDILNLMYFGNGVQWPEGNIGVAVNALLTSPVTIGSSKFFYSKEIFHSFFLSKINKIY